MGTHLLEVDGANLKRFAGGSASFDSYRGKAYSILDARDGCVNLTPVQAERIALAILQDANPDRAALTDDDRSEQAFPSDRDHIRGMDLRDYFAAQLIAGAKAGIVGDPEAAKHIAKTAYDLADAMLIARKAVVRG